MQTRPTAPRTLASRMGRRLSAALACLGRAERPSVDFPGSMEPVVQLRGAVTLLGRFPALAGIDLEVAAGEVVLLRGPNGAGKTTLLRCCAGLVPLARGEARVLGHDLADRRQARALRRRVGPPRARLRPLRRAHRRRQRAVLGPSRGRPLRRTSRRPSTPAGSVVGWPTWPSPASRPASVAAPRSPASWRADPSSGCSTSRTPGSTTRAATSSTTWCTGRRRPAPPIVLASHELDRAEALADRVVTIAGGTIAAPAPTTPPTEEPVLVP